MEKYTDACCPSLTCDGGQAERKSGNLLSWKWVNTKPLIWTLTWESWERGGQKIMQRHQQEASVLREMGDKVLDRFLSASHLNILSLCWSRTSRQVPMSCYLLLVHCGRVCYSVDLASRLDISWITMAPILIKRPNFEAFLPAAFTSHNSIGCSFQ